MFGRELALAEG